MRGATTFFVHVIIMIILCEQEANPRRMVEAQGADDGEALLVFAQRVQSDPTGVLRSWAPGSVAPSPCNWTGVTCDRGGHVTKLLLERRGLVGPVSPELGLLFRLRALSLSGNSFAGQIPSEVFAISGLEKVDLSSNRLSGTLPDTLCGKRGSLRFLDLSFNRIGSSSSSILPSLFQKCSRLRYLSLSHNKVSGPVPVSLGLCLKLQALDLSFNSFSGPIPRLLGNLGMLRSLSLSHNNLSASIPASLARCSALLFLDLSRNLLQNRIPSSLTELSNLDTLILSENLLSGPLPGLIHGGNLRVLNASLNRISGPIPTPTNCSRLVALDLAMNLLSGSIPKSLGLCPMLGFLNASNNQLSEKVPQELGKLPSIRVIDLSNNRLIGAFPSALINLSSLSVLRLGGNSFEGVLPLEIGRMESLQILDLQRLHLRGMIPRSLSYCRFLLQLDLSRNCFDGPIPDNLDNMTFLSLLDLSSNNLSGEVPASLGNLRRMETLDLSSNELGGGIPESLGAMKSLRSLNLSSNRLSGLIPQNGVLSRFGSNSFLGNSRLCGAPLVKIHCLVPPPMLPAPPLPHLSPGVLSRRAPPMLGTSAIIAIGAAATLFTCVIGISAMNINALHKRRKKKMMTTTTMHKEVLPLPEEVLIYESDPPSPDSSMIAGKLVLFSKSLPSGYEDWEAGTKALLDEECVVGSGAIGTVYRVTLGSGASLAVKRLHTLGWIKNQDEFEQEIGRLGSIATHENLLALQGYFWSTRMQLLLSDFLPNGSLFCRLHSDGRWRGEAALGWAARFEIALGTARGLAFLHHDCTPQIVHLGVKSANILLDGNLAPRISDYGLSKLFPMMLNSCSSRRRHHHVGLGYMAPELAACQSLPQCLTTKCDVYGFGIVLLELCTGRLPVENAANDIIILCQYVRSALECGRDCIDPHLQRPNCEEVMQVLKLGLVCTSQTPSKRPSMAEVVQVLESIKPIFNCNS